MGLLNEQCRVKEGTSAVLLQSGLNESWWADSMECYTYVRNVTDLLSDDKTPYERRFGKPFEGPIIPFGSLVEYHPITAKDQSRIHQFGKKVLPGLFLKYALYAGGIWKGEVLIADLEELETMDASEIYSKRLNAKEVIFPKQGEFIFPIADGRIKPLRGDQDLRTSTLVRQRPIREESHFDFLGESEGSLPQPQDSLPDAGEAINDFWSMSGSFIFRHHVETQSQTLLAERGTIPYSTEIHCNQSSLSNEWFPDSMECCCFPLNVQDLLSDWKAPCERRFGMPFNGLIPFGAMVEHHPILRLFEITSIWSKSLAMYIPWICIIRGENLENCGHGQKRIGGQDASEFHVRRFNSMEVLTSLKRVIFFVTDGPVKMEEDSV